MSHLSFETIARLVDEQPSALDSAHMAACATCRGELDAMRADVATLGDLPDLEPSGRAWEAIEARLLAEGLLRATPHIAPRAHVWFVPVARAAAVAAIFAGGALAGHALSGAPNRGGAQVATNTAPRTTTIPTTTTLNATSGSSASAPPAQAGTSLASNSLARAPRSVRLASTGNAQHNSARDSAAPANDDASLRALRDAENKYFSALSRYSQKAGTETNDPTARLAALEGIVLTTGAALAQAPTDPVINGYHLTALAQRDAMLKQVKATPTRSW